jgi:hypothetical protein
MDCKISTGSAEEPPFLTRRANRLGRFGDHLDPDGAIRLPFLVQNMQFAQVQGDENSFCLGWVFFCGMLAWQGLFSCEAGYVFILTHFNEGSAFCFLLSLFPLSPRRTETQPTGRK